MRHETNTEGDMRQIKNMRQTGDMRLTEEVR